jgi:hypothetical protein
VTTNVGGFVRSEATRREPRAAALAEIPLATILMRFSP